MGRLTGNFTGPRSTFLEAPVNFPDKRAGCYQFLKWALHYSAGEERLGTTCNFAESMVIIAPGKFLES